MNQDNGGVIGKLNTPTTTVASGVWTLQDQFEAQTSSIWPLAFPQITIANSCRFDDGSTDNLSKTFSASNRRTFTFSTWIKRGSTSTNQSLFSARSDSSNYGTIRLESGKFHIFDIATSFSYQIKTNRLLRDNSAWYHLVVAFDSTQSTSSDRIKLYVNGEQETSLAESSYPSENYQSFFNNNLVHYVGLGGNAGDAYDGYMAETIFVDGQQLTPTSFGAFNPVTNIWEPIGYAGTYGTTGFKLNYSDSSALGDDTSGNTNDFTVNNLTSIDQSIDTCSNNFATWNPLQAVGIGATFSNGSLFAEQGAGNTYASRIPSSIAVSSGKWYAEFKYVQISNTNTGPTVGISYADTDVLSNPTASGNSDISLRMDRSLFNNGSETSTYSASISNNDIIGVALDMDNKKVYFSVNGTFANSSNPADGTNSIAIGDAVTSETFMHFNCRPLDEYIQANFGAPPFSISSGNADANGFGNFEYAVPSGYFALCTKNLAEFG